MSGGGKTQTATQQVQIPPEVMARYRQVNQRAEAVARQPFQPYSSDPNAFVAPLTQTQVAGMQNINQAAGMSQPYFNAAAGMTLGGAQGVGPLTQEQIGYYQNPYTQSVVGSTLAGLQQQQGQQLSQQQAEAIKGGAFGGDRAGIQRAQLMGQQNLATAQAIAPLYQQGYQQAVQTAAGQQGVLASDLQRQLAAGQQLGGLGAAGQQAALAGAQAQLGAGTAEQQTQQAGLQALYNQFLQERGYPFQVAQFLANIAMGTGALSGSTTSTTQPAPFFSDEREKTNVQPLGEGMYAYDYIDDVRRAEEEGRPMPPKRVGPMAQDIEERAPGLVGEVGGHKVVGMAAGGAPPFNLRAPSMGSLQGLGGLQMASPPPAIGGAGIPIMRSAAAPVLAPKATGVSLGTPVSGKGGVSSSRYTPGDGLLGLFGGRNQSMGGMVSEPGAYASGGSVAGPEDMRAILAAIGQPLEFYGGKGLYGGAAKGGAGSPGYVPQGQIATPKLITAGAPPRMADSGLSQTAETGAKIAGLAKMGKGILTGDEKSRGLLGKGGEFNTQGLISGLGGGTADRPGAPISLASAPPADIESARDVAMDIDQIGNLFAARGGLMRHNYDLGGSLPYATGEQGKDPLQEIGEDDDQKYEMLKPASPPPSSGGSGLSDIANIAKIGASIFAMSDERMKDNIEPVGELYDGQPIYRYNMKGSPQTQLGLMAQDVERNGHRDAVAGLGGVKMVDYKRATDVAAGLAGRNQAYRGGYQEGGLAEEDLPILLAALQEGQQEERRPPGLAPVTMSDAEPVPLVRSREPEMEREPGLVVAQARTPDQPGASPVRSDERPAGVAPPPRAVAGTETGAPPGLLSRESSGRFEARNVDTGAIGRAQFMPSRLEDAKRAGVVPAEMTIEQFRRDPQAQARAERWHFGDVNNFIDQNGLDSYVGRSINGVPITREGLVSVAHLGGNAGMKRFLETGGRYNPADANGTRLSDYLAMGAGAGGGFGAPRERVTPGVAGPGRGPMDPASAPFYTLMQQALGKEGAASPVRTALTSENFVVPALAGIGSMLASRSPYLGSAIGEGLMGGTKAYTDLQKQQQEMGASRAATEQTMADIAQKAFFEYAGRGMVRYQKPDGSYGVMNFADYFALPRDRRPPIDPRFKEYLESIEPAVSGGRPAGATGAPGAPGAAPVTPPGATPPATPPAPAGAPGEARPSGVPSTVDLLPEDRTRAFDIARQISLESRSTLDQRRRDDFFQPQRAAATASQGVMQLTLPMAATIMALPTGQSLATSGPFTAAIQPYVAAMNNLVETATGQRGAVIDPNILGDIESVNKEIARLRSQTTSEAGQRAVTALDEMAKGIVSLKNAREGQTRILSKVLSDTQRNIDKDRWFSQWIDAGSSAPGGERGSFSDYARLSGQEANQEFDRRYSEAFYGEERKRLQKMMETRLGGTTSSGGQPMTAFEYVQKNAAQLPADQIVQFADRFGDNTLRYFGIQPQRVQQLRQELRNREQPRG